MRPGDTVVFRQEWTGEPHSVTMGTLVDDMMGVVSPLIEEYGLESEPPPDVMERYEAATESLPTMVGEGEDLVVNQNAAQPCFLEEGSPPEDGGQACAEQEQVQPAFTGRQTYYSSGFIPYEGESSNEFTVELSDDIEPGTYNYYCAFHGNFQSGTITVAAPDAEIPSQQEVSRQALAQIDEQAEPLIQGANDAAETPETEVYGVPVAQPFAGWAVEDLTVEAWVNEFVPETIQVDAGEAVTWSLVGGWAGHTVSFDVPEYFSQIVVEEDGTVVFTDDAYLPVDSPPIPQVGEEGPLSEPVLVDAGDWDGEGFISSGAMWGNQYRIRFTEPGTYPYACVIHPQMVGTVEVT